MPGQAVQLGPFIGGLNTKSDASAIAENELAVCDNFELDFDGSLRSRPPIVQLGSSLSLPSGGGGVATNLGWFRVDDATTYLIAADGVNSTFYYDGANWVLITSAFSASDAVPWNGQLWLLSRTGGGGFWTKAGGFTAVSAMQNAAIGAVYKSRLFVSPGKYAATNRSTIYRSGVPGFDSPVWSTTTNTNNPPVDIGSGDGEAIVSMLVYQGQLLLFRTNSIWTYSYASNPQLAVQQPLVQNVGLDDATAIEVLDGVIYFMFEGRAYTLQNGRVAQINEKVPFVAGTRANFSTPVAVSVFNRRVLFSFYDTVFAFSTETQTWSTWHSHAYRGIGKFVQRVGSNDPYPVAFGMQNDTPTLSTNRTVPLLSITDTYGSAAEKATYDCVMQTKNYDYHVSSQYKRLFWWGVDALFRNDLLSVATPLAYRSRVSWSQLRDSTWGSARNFTWSQPANVNLAVSTTRSGAGSGPLKKFVKLAKSLRFLQINYRVTVSTDGSTNTAPVKVFDLVTYVSTKEHVVEPVS